MLKTFLSLYVIRLIFLSETFYSWFKAILNLFYVCDIWFVEQHFGVPTQFSIPDVISDVTTFFASSSLQIFSFRLMDISSSEFKDQEIHEFFLRLFNVIFSQFWWSLLSNSFLRMKFTPQICFDLMTLFERKIKIVGGPGWVDSIFCDLCLQLGQ